MSAKRLWAAAASVAVVGLAVSGCSTADSDGGPSEDQVEITVGTDTASRIEPVIELFEEAYPNIHVSLVDSGSGSYDEFMQPQIAAGTAPDVLRTFPGRGNLTSVFSLGGSSTLLDLSDREWTADLSGGQQALFGLDGEILSVPMGSTAIGPVYNQTLLDELGLEVPQTIDEVLELCEAARGAGKVAYALFQKGGSILTSYALSAPLVYGPDPEFTANQWDGTATFEDSGWVDVFQTQLDMLEAGCFNDSPNGTDYAAASALVTSGQAVSMVLFTDVSELEASSAEGTVFVMGPQPAGSADENFLSAADSYGFGVNVASDHQEEALLFIDFLATADAQNAFAEAMGGAPSLPNDSFVGAGQTQSLLAEYINEGRTGAWAGQNWPNEVSQALADGSQRLFDGTATPREVAASMDVAFEAGKAALE